MVMISDPVGDFIVRLHNASRVQQDEVSVPYSKMKEAIALSLKKAGFVGNVVTKDAGKTRSLTIELLYQNGVPKIRGVQRISKPGRRLYAGVKSIFPVKRGRGVLVLSTPRGILTDAEARKVRAGGETLFSMW